jgi:hypothetical protein
LCPGFESLIRHHLPRAMSPDRLRQHRFGVSVIVLPALLVAAAGCVQVPQSAGGEAAAPTADAAPVAPASRAGSLQVVQWPIITIDRREFRAAPGARILNSNNLTLTPNRVPPGAKVQYELDGLGQVRLIRVLDAGAAGERVSPPRGPASGPQ